MRVPSGLGPSTIGAASGLGTAPQQADAPGPVDRPALDSRLVEQIDQLKRTVTDALASPAAMLLGWVGLLVSAYPSLWGKDGTASFKLDAWIYYHAVAQWHEGGSLYDWYANPAQHLWPFTYPPFAACAMTPLALGSDRAAQVLLVLLTPLCVAVTGWATARALGASSRLAWGAAPWLGLLGVVVLEPVYKTMEYGQVNAVLMLAVALDLLAVPQRSRWRGVLSGLAAAFKLTPAIAVLVLLARREWRAAATMVGTALGVTALCWVLSPSESSQFFLSAMWDPSRAGFSDYSGNQNLKGLVARWLPESLWTPVWGVLVLAVLAGAWLLLRRLDALRPGLATSDGAPVPRVATVVDGPHPAHGAARDAALDDGTVLAVQVSVAMVAGLLVSPISWSHHWVWCLPALMALTAAGLRRRSPGLLTTAVAGLAVFGLAMQWWFPEQNHVEQDWPFWATVVGSSYTFWALATGAVLWRAAGVRICVEASPRARAHHADR